MPALDHVVRQRPTARDIVEHHVVGSLLVLQQASDGLILKRLVGVRAHNARKALRHKLLGDTSSQRVESFNLPCFQSKGAHSLSQPASHEALFRCILLERLAVPIPSLFEFNLARQCPVLGTRRHVFERRPLPRFFAVHGVNYILI